MFYFSSFPYVAYDPTGENKPQLAIDITKRFRLNEIQKNKKYVLYDYDIKDRDRPDLMAEKYYGDSTLDWLIFIVNEIFDPYYQWPLTYDQFQGYIVQKYGSVSAAMGQIHHYEQIVTPRIEQYSNFDSSTIIIPEAFVIVDQTTYNSLAANVKRQVSAYDFELNLNNEKRKIKLLDKSFVPGIIRDVRRIFA